MTASTTDYFRDQWTSSRTLWSDQQTQELTDAIRCDLERAFGPPRENRPKRVRPAVGWCSEADFNRGRAVPREETALDVLSVRGFDGLRECHCLGCGQRIVWKPSFGDRVCGKRCAARAQERAKFDALLRAEIKLQRKAQEQAEWLKKKKAHQAKAAKKPPQKPRQRIAFLKPDPDAIMGIVRSVQQQLKEQHNILAHFTGSTLVLNTWHVLTFVILEGNEATLHVILNGSGPGRASWTMGMPSAYDAVIRTVGQHHPSTYGISHPR